MPENDSSWACDGGEPAGIWEVNFDFLRDSGERDPVQLEDVLIEGRSFCAITIGSEEVGCNEVRDFMELSAGEKTVLQTIVDAILPELLNPPEKLQKCPKVKLSGMTASKDKGEGYKHAAAAFIAEYAGALAGVSSLTPVDIKYPDGFVFTFEVLRIERFNPPKVNLYNSILNENHDKASNKCVD